MPSLSSFILIIDRGYFFLPIYTDNFSILVGFCFSIGTQQMPKISGDTLFTKDYHLIILDLSNQKTSGIKDSDGIMPVRVRIAQPISISKYLKTLVGR